MADRQAVRKIILRGNEAFSDEILRNGMRTEVGKIYDEEMLREDFRRIIPPLQEKRVQFRANR